MLVYVEIKQKENIFEKNYMVTTNNIHSAASQNGSMCLCCLKVEYECINMPMG